MHCLELQKQTYSQKISSFYSYNHPAHLLTSLLFRPDALHRTLKTDVQPKNLFVLFLQSSCPLTHLLAFSARCAASNLKNRRTAKKSLRFIPTIILSTHLLAFSARYTASSLKNRRTAKKSLLLSPTIIPVHLLRACNLLAFGWSPKHLLLDIFGFERLRQI
jgi:hypothetical protein